MTLGVPTEIGASSMAPNGDMAIFSLALSGAIDPSLLMQAISMQMRKLQSDGAERTVANAGESTRAADRQAEKLLRKAEKAARKASRRAPPWVKKLIGAVLTAVGSVLSIFGGAGAALVAAAVVLIAAGDIIDGMAERGMIPEKAGRIVGLCCKFVGAILMAGAGIASAGGSAATTASQTADRVATATQVLKLVKSLGSPVQQLVEVGVSTAQSVFQFQAENYQQNAEEQNIISEEGRNFAEAATEAIKNVFEQHTAIVGRLERARQAQHQAGLAAARALA